MLRAYLRALASMEADLAARPRAEHLSWAARQLFEFYDRENRLGGVLTRAEAPPKTAPAYPRGRDRKRERRYKPTSSDYALAILRESPEPMAASAVRERLVAEFKRMKRQTIHLTLAKLEREGKVERVEADGRPERHLWRAVD